MDGGADQGPPTVPNATVAKRIARANRWVFEHRIGLRRIGYWLFVSSVMAAVIALNLRWLKRGEKELGDFVEEHYGPEIASYGQHYQNEQNPPAFERPLGWITNVRAVKRNGPEAKFGSPLQYKFSAHVNWLTLVLVTTAYLTAAWAAHYALRLLGSSFGAGNFTKLPPFKERGPALAWAVYQTDIDNAQRFSEQLDRRSVLFLVIGCVVAIIGVAAVITVFPQELRTNETTPQLLLRMARPIGLTIFIEAIAWYFLKQSRVLVEDQRAFYRMYLKRANYLAALGLLPEKREEAPELTAAVLWSLLHDPVADRLAPGETTEALETMRALNELPVASGLKALVGAEKPDSK